MTASCAAPGPLCQHPDRRRKLPATFENAGAPMGTTPRIVIIGSGFGGLGLAIRLKRAGIDSVTILERADTLGGTWRDNTYPGAACDVPSMLYSLSFEPKLDWTRKWSGQAEIRSYMEECARKNDLLRHVRFGVEVASARFDDGT